MANVEIERKIASKLLWARQDGCPVAPGTEELANEMASIARRRWNSFERRSEHIPRTTENRIRDMARGIADRFETGGWEMVGPLINDYEWLCEQIAPILSETTD
jgi:hypothetical protein